MTQNDFLETIRLAYLKARKCAYTSEGPGGYVIYKEDESEIKLFFEYGGGDCVAIIYVPSIKEWQKKTNKPLADREPILKFIAEQAIKDKAPNCRYALSDICIEIFSLSSP